MTDVPLEEPSACPPRILLVAEAPGDEEMYARRPLVGPSGKLLDTCLRRAGIDRAACGVTNVFSTQLPDNEVANWCAPASARRTWGESPEAQVAKALKPIKPGCYLMPQYVGHLQRLAEEVKRLAPYVIIPLGSTALWAFTGFGASIMRRRGLPDVATWLAPGVKIFPTVHPAAVLRQYSLWHVLTLDLKHAVEQSAERRLVIPRRRISVPTKIEDLYTWEAKHLSTDEHILCIDIETKPKYRQITCVGFGVGTGDALVVPITDERKPKRCYWDTAEEELAAIAWIKKQCERPLPKLFQNGCVPGDTEVLTRDGWVRLDRFPEEGSEVVSWKTDGTMRMAFAERVRAPGGHQVISVKTRDHDCQYTLDHRVVHRCVAGAEWRVSRAASLPKGRLQIPVAGALSEQGHLRLIRFLVAVQADAHLTPTRAVFNLKKQHKINRLFDICAELGIYITETKRSVIGERSFSIRGEAARYAWCILGPDKLWPYSLVFTSRYLRELFFDELQRWDASLHGRGFRYLNKHRHNMDVVMAVAAVSERAARLCKNGRAVQITKQSYTNILPEHRKQRPTRSDMYCLCLREAGGGLFLARRNGRTFVTGNSYDIQWLYTLWGIRTANYLEDTRLQHHSIYPELPKGLGYLGTLYANPGMPWKAWGGAEEKRDA